VKTGRPPNLKLEQTRLAADRVSVAGCDEVGRGSLGGPVSVGIVVVDSSTRRPPAGLRDSKLLLPVVREKLVPRIKAWCTAWAIGHASAAEIDEFGILRALRLAGERALSVLAIQPDHIVLDGNYDWFTRPERAPSSPTAVDPAQVELKVKADLTCASVAAASVIAKVARDGLMVELGEFYPPYKWGSNKGYACPEHRAALVELGPCDEHRRSWRLALSGSLPSSEGDEALIGDEDGILEGATLNGAGLPAAPGPLDGLAVTGRAAPAPSGGRARARR
jgi:ribonuclease HII